MNRRRKSVFAESYEPGEENAAVEKVASLGSLPNLRPALYYYCSIADVHCGLPITDQGRRLLVRKTNQGFVVVPVVGWFT